MSACACHAELWPRLMPGAPKPGPSHQRRTSHLSNLRLSPSTSSVCSICFLVNHFHQCQAPGGGRARRLAAVARSENLSHPLWRTPAPANLSQRPGDAARQTSQESLRDQFQLDEISSPHHAYGAHLAHPRVSGLGGRAVAGPLVLPDLALGGG